MRQETPLASIIIRSKDRVGELRELLRTCLSQRYPRFEIVVVDSTEGLSDEDLKRALDLKDPRVTLIRTPPRGCAAAANEGVRASRGEILAFVDDDDVPLGEEWLSTHLRNYLDPACLGVQGGMIYSGTESDWALSAPPGAERWMLSFGFWKNA